MAKPYVFVFDCYSTINNYLIPSAPIDDTVKMPATLWLFS